MTQNMTIGGLAKRTGIGIETIRFYEKEKLLKPLERTPSGYRLYDVESVKRIDFIKGARELGFSLREIKGLLTLRTDSRSTRSEVRRQIGEKIEIVQAKIAALAAIKQSLERLHASCEGEGSASDCPILEAFERGGGLVAGEPSETHCHPN